MFTGLIQAQGRITHITQAGDTVFTIAPKGAQFPLKLGASIACNGICLTVTSITTEQHFTVAASAETLRLTTAAQWRAGTRINLEPSLIVGDALGGHLVSGHVDGIGSTLLAEPVGDSVRWRFRAPNALMKFIAVKGSIAIDGVSLTVNTVGDDWFEVNIIEHTRLHTHFATLAVGDAVNLEIDMLARYVARMLEVAA
jgi:riboflavin synthase